MSFRFTTCAPSYVLRVAHLSLHSTLFFSPARIHFSFFYLRTVLFHVCIFLNLSHIEARLVSDFSTLSSTAARPLPALLAFSLHCNSHLTSQPFFSISPWSTFHSFTHSSFFLCSQLAAQLLISFILYLFVLLQISSNRDAPSSKLVKNVLVFSLGKTSAYGGICAETAVSIFV